MIGEDLTGGGGSHDNVLDSLDAGSCWKCEKGGERSSD